MAQHQNLVSRLMILDESGRNSAQVRNSSRSGEQKNALLAALKACSKSKDLERGRMLHKEAIRSKQDSDIYIANSLVNMYAKCGSLVDAKSVFDGMKMRTVVSWNSLLAGYIEKGQEQFCLDLIGEMKTRGFPPDALTFVVALRALMKLASKEQGKQVNGKVTKLITLEKVKQLHTQAARAGFELHAFVNSSLINIYSKCGSMADARKVFEKGANSPSGINIVSWNSLLLGYVESGEPAIALDMFELLLRSKHVSPDALSFVAACKACACLGEKDRADGKLFQGSALRRGESIHARAARSGFELEDFVANSLIDMYGKCGSMADARKVFEKMPSRSVVAWNALLLGYVENGEDGVALELFSSIRAPQTCSPNALTFIAALKACSSWAGREQGTCKLEALERGKAVHSRAAECGLELENFVANSLIDMYAKCGSMSDAKRVFDRMVSRDIVSWNTLLLCYADNGEESLALELFESIRRDSTPTALTFVAALKACSSLAIKELARAGPECLDIQLLKTGKRIHAEATNLRLDSNIYVQSSLVNMYCKCNSLADARKVFDGMRVRNAITWNTLLLELVDRSGGAQEVLELYQAMLQEGCVPNSLTFAAVLKACVSLAASEPASPVDHKLVKKASLKTGKIIHSQVSEAGFESDTCVTNTLVDFYAKSGSLEVSKQIFDSMPSRTPVSWTTLMMAYVEVDRGDLALELFDEMQREGCFKLDATTFIAVLKACSSMAGKEEGRSPSLARGRALEQYSDTENTYVATALVSLYSKCGSMPDAQRVFDRVPDANRDLVLWNALLLGFVENQEEESALALFASFQQQRFQPDFSTLSAALKACSSMEFAKKIHRCICSTGLDNDPILATSLLDAYGKCGGILEARLVFESLLVKRDLVAWNALLGSYSRVGDAAAVIETFKGMLEAGVAPDGVTFLSLLSACSHAGLVGMGRRCLEAMEKLGVRPERQHWECVVDLMGRANELPVALEMAEAMPFEADVVTWTILLSACTKWRDETVARAVFDKVVKIGEQEDVAAAYVLMAGIYQKKE